nr:HisA/HisF-related TIM barrel protein [bacterium]
MILVPQLYLKNGKVLMHEGTTSPLFQDDPLSTARAMKDAGAEALYVMDLGVPPVGASPHLPTIKRIHDDLGLACYVTGGFKTVQSMEPYITAGVEIIALGSVAYQQPAFLDEACKKFPARIATHID